MKTNLHKATNAVLTKDNKVIAIISCPKNGDITKQLERAIKDEEQADSVKVVSNDVLDDLDTIIFAAEVTDEDGEVKSYEYEIQTSYTY